MSNNKSGSDTACHEFATQIKKSLLRFTDRLDVLVNSGAVGFGISLYLPWSTSSATAYDARLAGFEFRYDKGGISQYRSAVCEAYVLRGGKRIVYNPLRLNRYDDAIVLAHDLWQVIEPELFEFNLLHATHSER